MTTYAFRLTCKLAGENFAIRENTPLILPALTPSIQVMSVQAKDQLGNRTLILQGGGFSSEEEARAAGMPVKTAVMLAGLLLGVGIDVGPNQVLRSSGCTRNQQGDDVGMTFGRPVLKKPISNSNLEEKVAESSTRRIKPSPRSRPWQCNSTTNPTSNRLKLRASSRSSRP